MMQFHHKNGYFSATLQENQFLHRSQECSHRSMNKGNISAQKQIVQ